MDKNVASLTQSVAKALSILKCFTDDTPLLRVTDISSQLGLTMSLVSRLLVTLEHEGFVERDPESGAYRLGQTIIELSSVSLNHNRVRMEALTEMQILAADLELGVNLSILDRNSIFYLAHCDSPHAPRAFTLVGRHNALHATAMGKILLAHLPAAEQAAILETLDMPAYTIHTITDRARFSEELAQAYVQGWAREIEELALGRGCIASPIRDRQGNVVASLSISGPLSILRWEQRHQQLIDRVVEVADRISIRLGYITAPVLTRSTK